MKEIRDCLTHTKRTIRNPPEGQGDPTRKVSQGIRRRESVLMDEITAKRAATK